MAWNNDPNYTPPAKGKGSKLSGKMLAFVDEYFVDLVAYKAVLRAGYKCKNEDRAIKLGVELMAHPLVKTEIERRTEERREKSELTVDYVLNKLTKIVESTDTSNPQAALRGLELLGKYLGMYKERQEISGPDGGAIEMEQKTQRNVTDFNSRMASLVKRSGTGGVSKFPDPSGEG